MDEHIKTTKDFLQEISDQINDFVAQNFAEGWILIFQIFFKFLLLVLVIYLADFIFKTIINACIQIFITKNNSPVLSAIKKSKISNSLAHLLAFLFGKYALYSIFYKHPESFKILRTILNFSVVLVLANMSFRFLKALEYYFIYKKDHYKIVALKAISQSLKIFTVFIFSLVAIAVVFQTPISTIFGSLGAVTAVLVLVFRDTILGFVTGIHVATSQHIKEGDWIGIPKYNLEGTIENIDLLTAKIRGFDKTVSSIPTYDLLSTEIKNLQVMSESNTRRIKRSIIFNIKSFVFLNDEQIKRLSKINLLKDYLQHKLHELSEARKSIENPDELLNGESLTNIGTFRVYTFNYLKNNVNIDQKGTILVRQLDMTPEGLPLEIYCFTNNSIWENYEMVQADIFDHLLVAAKDFDLEVMQFSNGI